MVGFISTLSIITFTDSKHYYRKAGIARLNFHTKAELYAGSQIATSKAEIEEWEKRNHTNTTPQKSWRGFIHIRKVALRKRNATRNKEGHITLIQG